MEKKDELLEKFTKQMFKMETINFIGLAKMMGVPIANEEGTGLRDMEEIVAGILNCYESLSNSKKKEILKLCKQANKMTRRSDKNGDRPENSDDKSE